MINGTMVKHRIMVEISIKLSLRNSYLYFLLDVMIEVGMDAPLRPMKMLPMHLQIVYWDQKWIFFPFVHLDRCIFLYPD